MGIFWGTLLCKKFSGRIIGLDRATSRLLALAHNITRLPIVGCSVGFDGLGFGFPDLLPPVILDIIFYSRCARYYC